MFPGPKAASVKEKMLFVEPARYRTPSSEDEGGATVLSLAGLALTAPELLVLTMWPLLLSADASLCTTTSWLPSGLVGWARHGRGDGSRCAELRAGRVLLFQPRRHRRLRLHFVQLTPQLPQRVAHRLLFLPGALPRTPMPLPLRLRLARPSRGCSQICRIKSD